tara:strand:- start:507 stop:647 length:141 start_codon:yes stop_codon:yes gene_type:complete
MGKLLNIVGSLHKSTKRDYIGSTARIFGMETEGIDMEDIFMTAGGR